MPTIEYIVGESQIVSSFTAVTDTVSNAITTSGNCGNFVYTLSNEDGPEQIGFVEVVDLYNAKGIKVITENEDYIGLWNITVTVTMEDYPQKFNNSFVAVV